MFIPINRGNIGDNIQEHVINAEEKHEWTPQEIKHQKKLSLRWNLSNTPLETLQPQEAPQKALSAQALSTQAPSPQAPQEAPQQAPQELPQELLKESP